MENTCRIDGCSMPTRSKGLCNMHYQRLWKHGNPVYQAKRYELCTANGCTNEVRSPGCPYCEMHYGRLRRNGTLENVKKAHKRVHSQGYIQAPSETHPLAHGRCLAYEHRMVFYNAHGEGPFKCYWCGADITWDTLHIDHLNENKKDNDINNLVASCPICNIKRGRHRMVITARERRATWIEFNGQRRTAAEWAALIGIHRATLKDRIKKGWPLERALLEPSYKTGPVPLSNPLIILNATKPIQMIPFEQKIDAL